MSYILGAQTLPRPSAFFREYIESAAMILTLNNRSKKDLVGRKERFVLEFKMLTQLEVATILSEFDLNVTRNFSITETNLTLAATKVHIEITRREYNTKGNEYREDLVLTLTEEN